MFENKFDLFNIENIINLLKTKKNTDEFILFQTTLPNIDSYGNINIKMGESCANPVYSNYFLTYGILHEFLQVYNNINLNTFKYFSQNILEKKEQDIASISKLISKNDTNIKTFDYSHKNFFVDNNKYFTKGSYIKNITYCYNNSKIYTNILKIFLVKDVNKNTKFLIKFPSIVSQSILDSIRLISYSFEKITIFKNLYDSYFKDSFHIYAQDIKLNRYLEIQDKIKLFKTDNINDTYQIRQILDININNIYQKFDNSLKDFCIFLEIIIFVFLVNLHNLINQDKNLTYRNKNKWENLDYYNNYVSK
jgi:hypothetical protein